MEEHVYRGSPQGYEAVRAAFGGARVVVVGDLMLDCYLWGDVSRISPEAPVPVARLKNRSEYPGGAGNVARNLSGLGLNPIVAGIVGADADGDRLIALLSGTRVETAEVIRVASHPTTVKTRVVGGHQQMLRIDTEAESQIPSDARDRLLQAIERELAAGPAALILADYAKGVLDKTTCSEVVSRARCRAAGDSAASGPEGI